MFTVFASENGSVGGIFVDRNIQVPGVPRLLIRLRRDNTDFSLNPSRGSIQSLSLLRDAGSLGSDGTWTRVEGEFSRFFSLGETDRLRQQVLALTVWTSDTPTWNSGNRPPEFMASRLGGLFRMRGFPTVRYWGKSAIYYAAEYRVIPRWNPIGDADLAKSIQMDWWQFSLFAEAGRVSDSYNLRDLHTKMRWDVGIAARAMVKHLVVRADTAWSNEGWEIQLMVGHPF